MTTQQVLIPITECSVQPVAPRTSSMDWNGLWRSAMERVARWRSAEIEDTVQRHCGMMCDSFEREITQGIYRSRGI